VLHEEQELLTLSGQLGSVSVFKRVCVAQFEFSVQNINFFAGDALFFHSNVLHCSDPNDSPNRRWAFIMAYNRASNNPMESLAAPFPRYNKYFSYIVVVNFIFGGNRSIRIKPHTCRM
jgi:hypothetical protein